MTSPLLTSTVLGDQLDEDSILDGASVEQAAMTVAFMLEPLTSNSITLAAIEQDVADLLRGSAREISHTIERRCVEIEIDADDFIVVTVDREPIVEWSVEDVRVTA